MVFPFLTTAMAEGAEGLVDSIASSPAPVPSPTPSPEAASVSTWGDEFVNRLVKKVAETHIEAWIALGTLIVLGLILLAAGRSSKRWNAKMLAMGALSISLSFVLSYIRLLKMPTHGSITPGSMLPIMLFSACYGLGPGLLAGLAYGLLQYLQDPWFLNIWEFILDWLIAFAALGLAGIAWKKKDKWLYFSIPIAVLGRAIAAFLAGIIIANDYLANGEPLEIGQMTFSSPILFSATYNCVYLIPEAVICLLLALLIAKPVLKVMRTK